MDYSGHWLVVIGVSALIFALIRELVCWYFKYNAILGVLTEIRELLKRTAVAEGLDINVRQPDGRAPSDKL